MLILQIMKIVFSFSSITEDCFSPQQLIITTQINKNTDIQEIVTFLRSDGQYPKSGKACIEKETIFISLVSRIIYIY